MKEVAYVAKKGSDAGDDNTQRRAGGRRQQQPWAGRGAGGIKTSGRGWAARWS